MKKLTLFLCVLLVVIPIISAFNFDNVGSYNEELMTYTIKNAFGLGSDVATMKLETPEINYVALGYQKVAEITIDNKGNAYNNLIKGIELYHINDGMKPFTRQVDYKYFDGSVWIPFTKNTLNKQEKITLGLFTTVEMMDNVEWVIEMYDEKLIEWATWTSGLSDQLLVYYTFDEGTGTTASNSINSSENNLTLTSNWTTTGVLGNAKRASGSTQYNLSDIGLTGANGTVNFWFNRSQISSVAAHVVVGEGPTSSDGEWLAVFQDDNAGMGFSLQSAGIHNVYSGIGLNKWTMFTLTFTGNNATFYFNGTAVNGDVLTNWVFSDAVNLTMFGTNAGGAGNRLANTEIDEFAIWNKTLSQAEITSLYNGGLGVAYSPPPNVTLNTPAQNAQQSSQNVIFNCSATGGIDNITLNIDGLANQTLAGSGATLELSATLNVAVGSHTWSCNATNNLSMVTTSSTRSFEAGYLVGTQTFNSTTNEMKLEDYILNVSYDPAGISGVTANLILNGTPIAATVSGTSTETTLKATKRVPFLSLPQTQEVYWNLNFTKISGSVEINSTTQTQTMNLTVLAPCNETYPTIFQRFTFKNETVPEEDVEATIDSSSWTYWFDDITINKTFSYSNATTHTNYTFCGSPPETSLSILFNLKYNNGYSQQRTFETSTTLTNLTTNTSLFLLPTSSGQFVTFQVINNAEQLLSGVNATVKKGTTLIEQEFTDDAGSVQFFLNPDSSYVFTFSLAGYDTYTTTITPSQTSYTINLGGAEAEAPADYGKQVSYSIRPTMTQLDNSTIYSFNFTVVSGYWDVSSFGFVLTNGSTILGTTSAATNGGTVNLNLNTSLNRTIVMEAYWIINSTYQNVTKTWVVITTGDTSFSILHFFTDLTTYINSGLFGIDNFGLALFLFLFIFLFTGIMSFKFGLTSPETILVLIFSLVLFLDVGVGMMDNLNPINAIPHFPSVFMGLILVGLFFREVSR